MLLTFSQAKQLILQTASVSQTSKYEIVPLADALDRIIAQPIISPINVPSFDNSAMDGYAVRLSDLAVNHSLPLAGAIFAGDNFPVNWPQGSCLRIMTGAPTPQDADAVVMQEDTEKSNDKHILFNKPVTANQNIRRVGEDVQKESELFAVGQRLTIPMLSTLATLGISQLAVFKAIKVAIFSTGNELTAIGQPLPSQGNIYDSNRLTLILMLKQLGCEILDLGIIKDDPELIKHALTQGSKQADLIVTSGGVSVGDADYTKSALEELGNINFWKIAMKPGKPFAFGQIGNAIFCGLPGNPVSTMVTFYQLVKPLILSMSGIIEPQENTFTFKVKTISSLKKTSGRLDFQRGELITNATGELVVQSTGTQGSHITHSFNQANCFIVLEQERDNVVAGEYVTVELFDTLLR